MNTILISYRFSQRHRATVLDSRHIIFFSYYRFQSSIFLHFYIFFSFFHIFRAYFLFNFSNCYAFLTFLQHTSTASIFQLISSHSRKTSTNPDHTPSIIINSKRHQTDNYRESNLTTYKNTPITTEKEAIFHDNP